MQQLNSWEDYFKFFVLQGHTPAGAKRYAGQCVRYVADAYEKPAIVSETVYGNKVRV